MRKRIMKLLTAGLIGALLLTACSKAPSETAAPAKSEVPATEQAPKEESGKKLKMLVIIPGTRGDMSVNDLASRGLEKYAKDQGHEIKVFETGDLAGDFAKYESVYRDAFDEDWDIIFTNSKSTRDILYKILPEYPDERVVAYDDELDFKANPLTNIVSLNYKQNECSFLAGALAAKMTKTGTLGVVGCLESPVIHDFMYGFVQGALYANPDIKVLNSTVGSATDAIKAKELALSQISQGADILFPPAANATIGVLEACAAQNVFVIGVDSDRAMIMKETNPEISNVMPTSAVKNVEESLYKIAEQFESGKLVFGQHLNLGIKEGGVGLAKNEFYDRLVPDDVKKFIDETGEKVLSGEIKVDTAFGKTAEEIEKIRASVRP